MRSVGENGPALDMIPMTMAVDDIPHGRVEPLCELLLQPGRKGGVDRICEDDAVGGRHKEGVVVIVPRAINVPFDIRDFADWPAWSLLRRCRAPEQDENNRSCHYASHVRKHRAQQQPCATTAIYMREVR